MMWFTPGVIMVLVGVPLLLFGIFMPNRFYFISGSVLIAIGISFVTTPIMELASGLIL